MNISNFFLKNLYSSVKLIILFFLTNIFIFIIFVLIVGWNRRDVELTQPTFEIIENSISGKGVNKTELQERLKESGCFYYILNQQGDIIDQMQLPENLNHHYSLAEVVSTTRWFNDGYPIFTNVLEDDSVLFLGYPKGSYVKYNLYFSLKDFFAYLLFFPVILLGNLFLFLYLDVSHSRRFQKSLSPILDGIIRLSEGKTVDLEEKGPLSLINKALNQASEAAVRKEDNRREWISGISHDIRTPLMVILSSSEILYFNQGDVQKLSNKIRTNALKIDSLIDSLNLRDRLSYSPSPVNLKETNLISAIKNAVTSFINENNLEKYNLEVNLDSSIEKLTVPIDETLFERMLSNLLNNSVIHNPEGANINVDLFRQEGKILLIVSDNGMGISEDKVLELNKKEKLENYSKHGLGLLIVKKIAYLHNFTFLVDSQKNKGFKNIIII